MNNNLYHIMLISHGLQVFYSSEKALIRYYRGYSEDETLDIIFFDQLPLI
jgi:hypothetical protein